MMEPPKGPRTGCAFYPLPLYMDLSLPASASSIIFITDFHREASKRGAHHKTPAFMLQWSIYTCVI